MPKRALRRMLKAAELIEREFWRLRAAPAFKEA
jgi:hypothetical protein